MSVLQTVLKLHELILEIHFYPFYETQPIHKGLSTFETIWLYCKDLLQLIYMGFPMCEGKSEAPMTILIIWNGTHYGSADMDITH